MVFKEKMKDNWETDLWQSFDEPDVTILRNKLKNTRKLSDKGLRSYIMNTSARESK